MPKLMPALSMEAMLLMPLPTMGDGYPAAAVWGRKRRDAEADASIVYGGYAAYAPAYHVGYGYPAAAVWGRKKRDAEADASIVYGGYAAYAPYTVGYGYP